MMRNNLDYSISSSKNFTIRNVSDCNSDDRYGFRDGKPCILIKINKVCYLFFVLFIRNNYQYFNSLSQLVGFIPEIGRTDEDNKNEAACTNISNIPVQCTGEVCFYKFYNHI